MQKAITILVLIVVASVAYTLFGLATFEVDRPRPFVFNEPKPPEGEKPNQAADALTGDEKPLSPEEQQQKAKALSQAEETLALYKGYSKDVPSQAATTLAILSQMVVEGELPTQFLNVQASKGSLRVFERLKLSPKNSQIADGAKTGSTGRLSCLDKTPPAQVLVGNDEDNELKCDFLGVDPAMRPVEDRLFLGGPGNDRIQDTVGNRLVNGGSGDDQIDVGFGRTLVFLETGWGKDTLTVDCAGAQVSPGEIPSGSPFPWTYKYTNFIILGPGIKASDVSWKGLVLTNSSTGDTLTVNENCFNVVSLSR